MHAKRSEANAQAETIEMNPEDQNDDVMNTEGKIATRKSRALMARARRKESLAELLWKRDSQRRI
jgi:hypothetical protein